MKITLEQSEIEQALVDFVNGQGLSVSASDIVITVKDGSLSAAISTSALGLAAKPAATTDAVQEEPAPAFGEVTAEAPEQNEAPTEVDREAVKAELDKLGVDYAPKAHTGTLVTMLEEAKKQTETQEEAPSADAPESVEPPFETDNTDESSDLFGASAKSPGVEPAPAAEPANDEEDQRPLFGA